MNNKFTTIHYLSSIALILVGIAVLVALIIIRLQSVDITTTVANVSPTISGGTAKLCAGSTASNNASLTACSNITNITLIAGTATTVSYAVQVADNNGIGDLGTTATGRLFHATDASPANETCTLDNNTCYQSVCQKIVPSIDSVTAWYRCDYPIQYFTNDSAASGYTGYFTIQDSAASIATNSSYQTAIAKLIAGTFPTVAFGNTTLGFTSTAGNNIEIQHQNNGNVLLDYNVALDDDDIDGLMNCSLGGIPASGLKFDRDVSGTPGDLSYASATKTVTVDPTSIMIDIDISQRTNDGSAQGPTNPRTSFGAGGDDIAFSYWTISVPSTNALGSCQEELNVTAIEGTP